MRRGLASGLLVALLALHERALAADTPTPLPPDGRPRIGLALSGGGARGVAHVGVLKVLEEMRIPISCVTGTSMGSIVGGTYAVGTPPKRLEELVLAADWAEIFRDNPPRQDMAIRRKRDDFKILFAPEFGLKDGNLALPKGVIAGVSIEAFFRVLAQPAMGISDFSKLPIPFEAMATDIENGDSVVLNHGSVAQAMRASMSVPGGLAPVEIDGRLLVDGGIADNLPIDQARKLCGDVVIAVNISTPPLKRSELDSALAVSLQLVNFLGKQTVDQQIKSMGAGDVLIEPDLGDISAASFDRSRMRSRSARTQRASSRTSCRGTAFRPSNTPNSAPGKWPRRPCSARWTRFASKAWNARAPRSCAGSCRARPASRSPKSRSARTCDASTAAAITRASATASSAIRVREPW
jgi:predicted acylesterase/phospholipase RssA